MIETVEVIKRNLEGRETWRYTGQVLERTPHRVRLEARFNRADVPFHGILLREGDRFEEWFYADRWYNIFEIHDKDDERIKGWYCNVCCPAEFPPGEVSYIDLALDLLVYPDGRQLVLDEDEFEALELDPALRAGALRGLEQLKVEMAARVPDQGSR
jgi:predicted RNA-binding protein associated with RNAse of E/G family